MVLGRYTYQRRGLTTEFFPDTRFTDRGGDSGWLPFVRGTLTGAATASSCGTAARWRERGVDVLFDLGADCQLCEVVVEYVLTAGFICAEPRARLAVRRADEARYRYVSASRAADAGANPWLRLDGLDNNGALSCVCTSLPAGQPPYGVKNVGLAPVHLLGRRPRGRRRRTPARRLSRPAEVPMGRRACSSCSAARRLGATRRHDGTSVTAAPRLCRSLGRRLGTGRQHVAKIHTGRAAARASGGYRSLSITRGVTIEGDAGDLYYGATNPAPVAHRQKGETRRRGQ